MLKALTTLFSSCLSYLLLHHKLPPQLSGLNTRTILSYLMIFYDKESGLAQRGTSALPGHRLGFLGTIQPAALLIWTVQDSSLTCPVSQRAWPERWTDPRWLRNSPRGLSNRQLNFLHGGLGFQEWVFQEAGSRIFPSLKVQALKLVQCYFHITTTFCWSPWPQSLLKPLGKGHSPTLQGPGCRRTCGLDEMAHDSNCWAAKAPWV